MVTKTKQFYYKNNRLQQLRGFCYMAQFGSISRAAKYMGMTHSSVSIQIKSLSEDLGVMLIIRHGPHISLTPEGIELFKMAMPIVDYIQNLPDSFREKINENEQIFLNIGVNSTTLNFIMPPLIKRFLESHPDYFFNLHYTEHHEAIKKIMSDEIDFAVLPRRDHLPFPNELIYTPLFWYRPSLISRSDHPLAGRQNLTVQEIAQYELTLPAPDLRVISNLYDIFPQNDLNKRLRVNFIDWETTRKYIEEGLAISISSDVIIGENDTLVATPLTHLFSPIDYGILLRRDKKISFKVNNFISVMNLNRKPII